jgi:hypothetical protein
MCRNIKTLFNFDPPATDDEIRASALQFVRKLSGCSILIHPRLTTRFELLRCSLCVSSAALRSRP